MRYVRDERPTGAVEIYAIPEDEDDAFSLSVRPWTPEGGLVSEGTARENVRRIHERMRQRPMSPEMIAAKLAHNKARFDEAMDGRGA